MLASFVLHIAGYDLKGLYSLEEYYAKDLAANYDAIAVGPLHNYYMGRAESDISKWVEYFCIGMAKSFEAVAYRATEAAKKGVDDKHIGLRSLDTMQRKCLELFQISDEISSSDIQQFLSYKPRSATALLSRWVSDGFLIVTDPGRRTRKYALAKAFRKLLD
ncbi:MAG: hypothetical protein SGI77_22980 [Pirellulaceae bacterium]|nr:hypothetical protein [Pirellulaceae bacterium]